MGGVYLPLVEKRKVFFGGGLAEERRAFLERVFWSEIFEKGIVLTWGEPEEGGESNGLAVRLILLDKGISRYVSYPSLFLSLAIRSPLFIVGCYLAICVWVSYGYFCWSLSIHWICYDYISIYCLWVLVERNSMNLVQFYCVMSECIPPIISPYTHFPSH